jgi:large subunit ribosomal protein L1
MVEFRVNDGSFIMNKIGKRSFSDEDLHTNLDAFMSAIARRRPDSVKGKLFKKALVKTSMGPPLRLDLEKYQEMARPQ